MRRASIVCTANLSGLEAAALGRPVVLARRSDDGRALGPVLTEGGYERFGGDIFGTDLPAETPERVWAAIDALDTEELARIRALVIARNSGRAQANALLEALAGLEPLSDGTRKLVGSCGELVANLSDELADSRARADELWAAREWYEEQLRAARAD
jgi:hypothetical protein